MNNSAFETKIGKMKNVTFYRSGGGCAVNSMERHLSYINHAECAYLYACDK